MSADVTPKIQVPYRRGYVALEDSQVRELAENL